MDAHTFAVGAFPLMLAAEGERVRIVAVGPGRGGGRGAERRIGDLGLAVGSEVTILQRQGSGAMIVGRDDLRLALGAGIAHRVLVVRIADTER